MMIMDKKNMNRVMTVMSMICSITILASCAPAAHNLEQQVELKGKLVSKPLRNKYFSETVVFQ